MSENRPRILVPGRMSSRARERLPLSFDPVFLASGDPALVTAEMAETVTGIAAQGPVSGALMDALPKLEIIANFGVGYDWIDTAHAVRSGIMVTHTPEVLNEEVADTAIALLLNTVRQLPQAEQWLREGRWVRDGAFALTPLTLRGRSVGIYGLGRIGLAIARRLEGFGVTISYHTRNRRDDVAYDYYPTLIAMAEAVDTIIVIVPGSAETRHAINAAVLKALGPQGVLINIGRGSTVDEAALAEALHGKVIAGAGLDVFEDEPSVPGALLSLPNVSLLPHVGSASQATRDAMSDLVVDNLIAWFSKGEALTPVPETRFKRGAR